MGSIAIPLVQPIGMIRPHSVAEIARALPERFAALEDWSSDCISR